MPRLFDITSCQVSSFSPETTIILFFHFTCACVFSRQRAVAGLDEHLLSVGLDHVDVFADLLESHLERNDPNKLVRPTWNDAAVDCI